MDLLLEPFAYTYMARAIWVSALVGGVWAALVLLALGVGLRARDP